MLPVARYEPEQVGPHRHPPGLWAGEGEEVAEVEVGVEGEEEVEEVEFAFCKRLNSSSVTRAVFVLILQRRLSSPPLLLG